MTREVCSTSVGSTVEVEIADGNAAPVLIDRSTPESLVVVGSRGRGVFDGIARRLGRPARRAAGGRSRGRGPADGEAVEQAGRRGRGRLA